MGSFAYPLSVIVPNYNHAPYLTQRLKSVLNQDFKDFELIILDDKSTDDSLKVIKSIISEYPDCDIKVVENDKNTGSPFAQWSKGIKLAKGEYVWIAESDDYASEKFLSRVMTNINENDLDLCFTQSFVVDASGREKGLLSPQDYYLVDHVFTFDDVKDEMCTRNMVPNASAVVFRRQLALPYVDIIQPYRMGGDWVFWTLILNSGTKHGYISEPLNFYRKHDTSTSTKAWSDFRHIREAFLVMKQFKNHAVPYNYKFWVDRWLIETGYSAKAILYNNFWATFQALYRLEPKGVLYLATNLVRGKKYDE